MEKWHFPPSKTRVYVKCSSRNRRRRRRTTNNRHRRGARCDDRAAARMIEEASSVRRVKGETGFSARIDPRARPHITYSPRRERGLGSGGDPLRFPPPPVRPHRRRELPSQRVPLSIVCPARVRPGRGRGIHEIGCIHNIFHPFPSAAAGNGRLGGWMAGWMAGRPAGWMGGRLGERAGWADRSSLHAAVAGVKRGAARAGTGARRIKQHGRRRRPNSCRVRSRRFSRCRVGTPEKARAPKTTR